MKASKKRKHYQKLALAYPLARADELGVLAKHCHDAYPWRTILSINK